MLKSGQCRVRVKDYMSMKKLGAGGCGDGYVYYFYYNERTDIEMRRRAGIRRRKSTGSHQMIALWHL